MSNLYLAATLLLLAVAPADDPPPRFPRELADWYKVEIPPGGELDWLDANNDAEHTWVVTPGAQAPRVDLLPKGQDGPPPSRSKLPFVIEKRAVKEDSALGGLHVCARVQDGWIAGSNKGEWGGALWWFSPEGARREKLSPENVADLIPTSAGLLALDGVTTTDKLQGRITKLVRGVDGRWRAEPFVELGHTIEVATTNRDGSLLVATSERLLRVIPASKKVEVLLDDTGWGLAYPNSIVVDNSGAIYLGMRHLVAKVERRGETWSAAWLMPSKAYSERKRVEGFK